MPFRSEKQRKWMHANHPKMAKRWEKETSKAADLPEKVASAFVNEFEKIGGTTRQLTFDFSPPKVKSKIDPALKPRPKHLGVKVKENPHLYKSIAIAIRQAIEKNK